MEREYAKLDLFFEGFMIILLVLTKNLRIWKERKKKKLDDNPEKKSPTFAVKEYYLLYEEW